MTPPLSNWTIITQENAAEILETDEYKNLTATELKLLLTEKLMRISVYTKGYEEVLESLNETEKEIFKWTFTATETGIDVPIMNKSFSFLKTSDTIVASFRKESWIDHFRAAAIKEALENGTLQEDSFLSPKELMGLIELFPGEVWDTQVKNYEKLFGLEETGIHDPEIANALKIGLSQWIICVPSFTLLHGIKYKHFTVGTAGVKRIVEEDSVPVIISRDI